MNLRKLLPFNLFKSRSKSATEEDCFIQSQESYSKVTCAACNGSGNVVTGYRAVCMESVETTEKCPDCDGKGYLQIG